MIVSPASHLKQGPGLCWARGRVLGKGLCLHSAASSWVWYSAVARLQEQAFYWLLCKLLGMHTDRQPYARSGIRSYQAG